MSKRVLVVAEAGVNHNGDLGRALEMVDAAAAAGADAVKFQSFSAVELATKGAGLTERQLVEMKTVGSQREMLSSLELGRVAHESLLDRCKSREIAFMSSAFDAGSLRLLLDLEVSILKVPSGEITNLPYLRDIAAAGKPVLLSSGMADLEEVRTALDVMTAAGLSRNMVTVLHCTSNYPTSPADVNITAIRTLSRELDVATGYSDHTLGREAAIAAVVLGAVVVEKHFTLDRTLTGPDHQASLLATELTEYIESIHATELILGDSIKRPVAAELPTREVVRKSIVAARDISKGEVLTPENLTTKRPGSGISPMRWDEIIGTVALRNFASDEAIEA